jgi:putative colanic acid biosynthesis UDP-glucose lipid carrier transferase
MPIQTRYNYLLRYVLMATDAIMLNSIYFFSFYITGFFGKSVSHEINASNIVVCNLVWLLCALFFGLYSVYGTRRLERIYRDTWRTIIFHFLGFTMFLLFILAGDFSRTFIFVFYGVLLVLSR